MTPSTNQKHSTSIPMFSLPTDKSGSLISLKMPYIYNDISYMLRIYISYCFTQYQRCDKKRKPHQEAKKNITTILLSADETPAHSIQTRIPRFCLSLFDSSPFRTTLLSPGFRLGGVDGFAQSRPIVAPTAHHQGANEQKEAQAAADDKRSSVRSVALGSPTNSLHT